MTRYGLVCLLLGSLSWGQATGSMSTRAAQQPAAPATTVEETTTRESSAGSVISNVTPDKPLITITGLCDNPSTDEAAAHDCKTVITQAQFEEIIDAIQPGMRAHARREFAMSYAEALVMTKRAEQMGLDKGAKYEEQMKLARIQVLSQELKKVIQEKVSRLSDDDIEVYYHTNIARFETVEVDRIYVPKARQLPPSFSNRMLTEIDRQEHLQDSEQTMREVADKLRARAVGGEEFTKLQVNAYQVAGIRSPAPNTRMEIRRTSLPPDQALVMDLKAGEVSSVLVDPNGYVIYKLKSKDVLPLDKAREEIEASLRLQRLQDELRKIQDSATPTLDESYFARKRLPRGSMAAGDQTKPASKSHTQ